MTARVLRLWCWGELVWTLLSWTATVEQIVVGALVSLAVAVACAPLGSVAGPWVLLSPRRLWPHLALLATAARRVVLANGELTRAIWSRRPIPSGMVVVPTAAHSDGELTTVGIVTSLIVNSQLVDLDRYRDLLQYHAVRVRSLDPERNRATINGPIETRTLAVTRS